MSNALREIKRRMAATRQIRDVTTALQRVATARLQRERRAIATSQYYLRALSDALAAGLAAEARMDHPLLRPPPRPAPPLIAVFGSERGLCGGFNLALLALATRLASETTDARVIVFGSAAARRLRRFPLRADPPRPHPPDALRAAVLRAFADEAAAEFLGGRRGSVHLVYARFESALVYRAVAEVLLPATPPAGRAPARTARFDPSARAVVDELVPEYVRAAVVHAFLNTLGSENAARQAAMGRASGNARDLLDELGKRFSRVRQETITAEMLERVGGKEAA
jgi:F-type H+-transporting ATPase subunit gamma